jgi:hypothetical protein
MIIVNTTVTGTAVITRENFSPRSQRFPLGVLDTFMLFVRNFSKKIPF